MPARIPVYDTPQVEAHGYSNPGPQLSNDNSGAAVTRGLDQLGQESDQLQQRMDKAAAEAKAKANAISQANADAAYQNAETAKLVGGTNRGQLIDDAFNETGAGTDVRPDDVQAKPGFFNTRGMDAAKQSGQVLDSMEKTRQQIAESNFSDEEERQKWLARSAGMLADTNRKVQSHTAQQFQVAQEDAVKGQLASGLQAIPSTMDPKQVAEIGNRGEASIRALNPPGPAVEAAVGKWWSEVASTHIVDGLLGAGDISGARAAYNGSKGMLGTQANDVEHKIALAEKVQTAHALDIGAQDAVDTAITVGSSLEGKPDLGQIDDIISKVPAGPMRDEIAQRLGPAKERAIQRWKEKVNGYADQAGTTFEKTLDLGAVDPKVKVWLQDNAPDEWKKLRHDAEAYQNHIRAKGSSNRAAIKEQADIDELAKLDFINAHPDAQDRATADVDAFLRGRGASPIGAGKVKQEQTRAIASVKAGDAVGESEFVADVKAKTIGILPADPKQAKLREAQIVSQAIQSYADLREKAKGKPSKAEVDAEADRLTKVEATAPRGWIMSHLPGVAPTLPEMTIEKQIREQTETKKPTAKPLSPGKYKDKNGKVWTVDAQGNKTPG